MNKFIIKTFIILCFFSAIIQTNLSLAEVCNHIDHTDPNSEIICKDDNVYSSNSKSGGQVYQNLSPKIEEKSNNLKKQKKIQIKISDEL